MQVAFKCNLISLVNTRRFAGSRLFIKWRGWMEEWQKQCIKFKNLENRNK